MKLLFKIMFLEENTRLGIVSLTTDIYQEEEEEE